MNENHQILSSDEHWYTRHRDSPRRAGGSETVVLMLYDRMLSQPPVWPLLTDSREVMMALMLMTPMLQSTVVVVVVAVVEQDPEF